MLACDDAGLVPDLICLGKGLGGGIPVSACVGRARVMDAWGAHGGGAIHTGTHFGSPPSCAAALATLTAIRGGLMGRAAEIGTAWLDELARAGAAASPAWTVRGRGLMVGVQLGDAAEALAVARALLLRGYIVLTGGVRGDVLTLSPPLTISAELLSAFVRELGAVIALRRAQEHGART
jgi:4-aminobutyrate aminotransferase/(S)-3-amino-2-methylpropionate transaminase